MKKKIYIILCAVLWIWTMIGIIQSWKDPPNPEDFTVEERIFHESIIF